MGEQMLSLRLAKSRLVTASKVSANGPVGSVASSPLPEFSPILSSSSMAVTGGSRLLQMSGLVSSARGTVGEPMTVGLGSEWGMWA